MASQEFVGEESSGIREEFSTRKLCAISKYYYINGGPGVLIGILDLDSRVPGEGFTTEIRLSSANFRCDGLAFCAVGSTLYVFEGLDRNYRGRPISGKKVFTIELKTGKGEFELNRESLQYTRKLKRRKYLPIAIKAPKNKIMVFPMIRPVESEIGGLELYDPAGGPSQVLPPLPDVQPCPFRSVTEGWILSYSFIRDTEFLVNLEGNILVIDLNSVEKGWQVICVYPDEVRGLFYVFDDRFYFTSDGVYDKAVDNELLIRHEYVLKELAGRQPGAGLIAMVGDGYDRIEEECKFCIYRMGLRAGEYDYGKVIISLCCTSLRRYKQVMEEKGGDDVSIERIRTKETKTVEFQLDLRYKYPALTHTDVFTF